MLAFYGNIVSENEMKKENKIIEFPQKRKKKNRLFIILIVCISLFAGKSFAKYQSSILGKIAKPIVVVKNAEESKDTQEDDDHDEKQTIEVKVKEMQKKKE